MASRPCEFGALVKAGDGIPARCVGPWSRDKLDYIGRYLDIFSVSMHKKWPVRHYIDLFSGPGRCVVGDGSGECDGSPFLALKVPHPFTEYHFVEKDGEALEALKRRVSSFSPEHRVKVNYYQRDANDAVRIIARNIPSNSLNVAIIDPTGLHFGFAALEELVKTVVRCDLIYLFAEGMSVKRNKQVFLSQEESRLDEVLGDRSWRKPGAPPAVMIFQKRLAALGYETFKDDPAEGEILVRNRKGVGLYYLVFASKHPKGKEFWEKIRQREPSGQMSLRLTG